MTTELKDVLEGVEEREGLLIGRLRRPVNQYQQSKNSIHEDSTAQRLGLRGGTVAGTVHLELFPPLFLKAFGQRWFERGNISIYFLDPTKDREEVRAVIEAPPKGAEDVQVKAWIERPDGNKIGAGTAAVGDPGEKSELLARDLTRFPPGELRILADASVGDKFEEMDICVTEEMMTNRLGVITDPLPWYEGESPWGGPIVMPAALAWALNEPANGYLQSFRRSPVVGLWGATELRNINGPMLAGVTYRGGGHVVALGETPKTEYIWFESFINDADGRRVAEMRMMTRLMKGSSALYQQ